MLYHTRLPILHDGAFRIRGLKWCQIANAQFGTCWYLQTTITYLRKMHSLTAMTGITYTLSLNISTLVKYYKQLGLLFITSKLMSSEGTERMFIFGSILQEIDNECCDYLLDYQNKEADFVVSNIGNSHERFILPELLFARLKGQKIVTVCSFQSLGAF